MVGKWAPLPLRLSCALYNRYNCEKMVLIVLTQRHGGTKAQSDL